MPQLLRPEVAVARKLRRQLSLPELLLWQRLRGRQLGYRFRRQHPVGCYIADFYCAELKTILEIDGAAHDHGDRPERDAARDRFMTNNGYRVVRVSAQRILADPDTAADAIVAYCARPLHHPADGPPPRTGED